MKRWTRSWITTIVAWAAVLFVGGAAIAGVSSHASDQGKTHSQAQVHASESEGAESEAPEASESPDANESPKADNHGQCVSAWAHKAKAGFDGNDPLEGHFFGGFVSEVAQSDGTGADCDQSDAFAKALAEQDAASTEAHGQSSAKHGHKGEHGPPSGS